MFLSVFGLAAGIGMPMQTSINAQLGRRVGSPVLAAMLNFMVGLAALLIVTCIWERGLAIPMGDVFAAPPWILMGGAVAVLFVTGNILLMPRLGSAQRAEAGRMEGNRRRDHHDRRSGDVLPVLTRKQQPVACMTGDGVLE